MQFKVLRILCSSTKPCSQVWIKDLTNSLKGLCYLRKLQHELAAEFSWETSTFPKFISHLNSLIRHGIAACSHRIETPTNDAWDSISDFQEQPYWLISHVIIMNSIEHRPLCLAQIAWLESSSTPCKIAPGKMFQYSLHSEDSNISPYSWYPRYIVPETLPSNRDYIVQCERQAC